MWDLRPGLASEWLRSAEEYEERLRASKSLDPVVIEAVLEERNRICSLFNQFLPEFVGRTSVVILRDALVENCAVFVWEDHLYVLVSGALLGRPFDYPQDTGIKAWEWLARHEAVHVRKGHLPWFFHTRRFFRLGCRFCSALAVFLSLLNLKLMCVWGWCLSCGF